MINMDGSSCHYQKFNMLSIYQILNIEFLFFTLNGSCVIWFSSLTIFYVSFSGHQAFNYIFKSSVVYICFEKYQQNFCDSVMLQFRQFGLSPCFKFKGLNIWMLDGSTNIWFSIIHENSQSCVRIDMNILNIMCTWIFLELMVTKLFYLEIM